MRWMSLVCDEARTDRSRAQLNRIGRLEEVLDHLRELWQCVVSRFWVRVIAIVVEVVEVSVSLGFVAGPVVIELSLSEVGFASCFVELTSSIEHLLLRFRYCCLESDCHFR